MANLRVGNVEIDGRNVRINSTSVAGLSSGVPTMSTTLLANDQQVASPPSARFQFLGSIPIRPSWIAAVALVPIALGFLRLALTNGPLDPENFIRRGAILIVAGIGILVLAGLKAWIESGVTLPSTLAGPDVATRHALERLRAALKTPGQQTIPSLAQRLGWHDDDVVRALGWLRDAGELEEDVDLASGEYHYVLIARPQDLESRLRNLPSGD